MESPSARLDLSQYPTPPTQLLTASSGWSALNLGEVWQSHELLFSLAWRDLRARYKQTALGAVWVVVQPLMGAAVYSFVLALVAGLRAPEGMPYFVFVFAGVVAWNGFATVLTRSSGALVGNSVLVSKIYFPRLVLPAAAAFTVLVDFLVALGVLAVMVIGFWHPPGWQVLLMPVCVLLLGALALGLGLCAAAVAVSYRDVLFVLPVFSQFLMWGSAVLFPMERVPAKFVPVLYLNPVVSLIEAFRWSVLGAGQVRWGYFAYSAAFAAVVLLCGAFAFRRMEKRFADVI